MWCRSLWLCDGGAAGLDGACLGNVGHGPRQSLEADAAVIEEVVVFGCQKGLDEERGNFIKLQGAAVLLAKLTDQFSIAAVNLQWGFKRNFPELLNVWQLRAEI